MPITDSIQSNKQHAVPQNIMDVEFKLIGDLTMRQFAYLCIFGGLAYLVTISPAGVFKIPLFLFFCGLGIGLAFIPIEERGLDQWIVNFFKSIYSPTQMIWKKETTLPSIFLHESINVVKQELITLAPTSSRRQLEEYLRYQEGVQKTVDPLDIPEMEYAEKVKAISASLPDYEVPSAPAAVELEESELEVISPPPPEPEVEEEPEQEDKVIAPQPIIAPPEEELPPEQVVSGEASVIPPAAEIHVESIPAPVQNVSYSQQPSQPKIEKAVSRPVQKPMKKEQLPPTITKARNTGRDVRYISPMNLDMHSGRRFMHLLPTSGMLNLPTRTGDSGPYMPQQEREHIEEDLRDKAQKLQQLLDQIKETEFGQKPSSVQTAPKPEPGSIVMPPSPVQVPPSAVVQDGKYQELQKQLEVTQKQLQDKQVLLDNLSKVPAPERTVLPERTIPAVGDLISVPTPGTSSQAGPVQGSALNEYLSTKPNVVTGVMKDPSGKTLEGVLLLIKNTKGDPVRAFKTNKLGQFITTTPLANGSYVLEVSPMNELGLTFDIISVEAKGQVIPSFEIIGRS